LKGYFVTIVTGGIDRIGGSHLQQQIKLRDHRNPDAANQRGSLSNAKRSLRARRIIRRATRFVMFASEIVRAPRGSSNHARIDLRK
jgi:hypothetical protein